MTEESGIAKGIRRIVAVTGQEAQDVTRVANNFRDRLSNIERLSGKEKDASLKAFAVVRVYDPRCLLSRYLISSTGIGPSRDIRHP